MAGGDNMKYLIIVLFLILLLPVASSSATDATLQQKFFKASQAYNNKNYTQSIDIYESLIQEGYASKEVYFNLANAYFRDSNSGLAIANYRRAWFYQPNDPDIIANMNYAIESARSTKNEDSFITDNVTKFSMKDWRNISFIGIWGLVIFILLFRFLPQKRFFTFGIMLSILISIISFTGIGVWKSIISSDEIIIVNKGIIARYAPLVEGKEYYSINEGSRAIIIDSKEGWNKINFNGRQGWVQTKVCEKTWK